MLANPGNALRCGTDILSGAVTLLQAERMDALGVVSRASAASARVVQHHRGGQQRRKAATDALAPVLKLLRVPTRQAECQRDSLRISEPSSKASLSCHRCLAIVVSGGGGVIQGDIDTRAEPPSRSLAGPLRVGPHLSLGDVASTDFRGAGGNLRGGSTALCRPLPGTQLSG